MSKFDRRHLPVKPIPKTKHEMLAERLTRKTLKLHDLVEQVLLDNMEDEVLSQYLEAWYDDAAVTGKCQFDDFKAAERIIELAEGNTAVSLQKPTVVMKALGVALRRFGMSRKQRVAAAMQEAEAQAAAVVGATPAGTVVS